MTNINPLSLFELIAKIKEAQENAQQEQQEQQAASSEYTSLKAMKEMLKASPFSGMVAVKGDNLEEAIQKATQALQENFKEEELPESPLSHVAKDIEDMHTGTFNPSTPEGYSLMDLILGKNKEGEQEEKEKSIMEELTDLFFQDHSGHYRPAPEKENKSKNRSMVNVTYEQMAKMLQLPEGVEIIATIDDPSREIISFKLASEQTSELTPATVQGQRIKSVSLDDITMD